MYCLYPLYNGRADWSTIAGLNRDSRPRKPGIFTTWPFTEKSVLTSVPDLYICSKYKGQKSMLSNIMGTQSANPVCGSFSREQLNFLQINY